MSPLAILFISLCIILSTFSGNTEANSTFSFKETTINDIQIAFKQNTLTSRQLVEFYLSEIQRVNPTLKGIIEVNPDALILADKADQERKSGAPISLFRLHGIPVLVKDNIATKDKLSTTAGSLALVGSIVPQDAGVVKKLRNAGAIILGKATMSEWAAFRSTKMPSGWNGRLGQALNPYVASADPSGSSTGSATSVAANLAAVTLGTETAGSILYPSSANSVVGIKPTVGLTSRAGVIPISHRQDTVGYLPSTPSMGDKLTIGVDCHGEWFESNNRYIWCWKGKEMAETIAMTVHRDVMYEDFANKIISYCELNCELKDLAITYMHSCGEKQRVAPFRIKNQISLRTYLEDEGRPILRVYVVERLVENRNLPQDQQMLNDECDWVNMDIPDKESAGEQITPPTPTPEVASNTPETAQSSQSSHAQDDETGFYTGMSFKNKQELDISLKIACVKKDFRMKKVINSRTVYCVKCVHPECKWWLRAVKLESSDRFYIRKYEKLHTCGSQHLTSHNPHATAKVVGAYFKDRFPKGKGPSTKDIENSIRIELGCKVSYWKVWRGSEIAKSLVRGTHEHGYAVLDAYRYMLTTVNPRSKTALKLDENGNFKYFFVAYGASILGFQHIRKVIAVDGTFLNSKYGGVLLSAVAQDAEKHIFPVAFCVANTECDASYRYFFEQMRSFVDDTSELCIISDRHPSIKKMAENVFPSAHYGCCMRHLGENIRNNFHNGKVVYHFYKAAKAYTVDEFNDHFNQIRDMVPGAAAHLERVGFHRWSRAFFPGNRYKIMTTNIAESINAMFLDEREYPITALFDEINRRYGEKFHERRNEFLNASTIFVPSKE